MVAQLWSGSRRMGNEARVDARFTQRWWRITLASAIMGVVLFAGQWVLSDLLMAQGWRWAALGILVAAGIVTYAIAGVACGAFKPSDFKTALRSQR
jgi:putative peptidoglycan lipid II flippase